MARVTLGDHFGFCAVADHLEVTVRASVEFVRLFGCLDELFVFFEVFVVWQAGQEGFNERLGLLDELAQRLENGRLVRFQRDVHAHDE